MGKIRKPRAGSLALRPRKRAEELTPRIRSWAQIDKPCLLGFPAYKVGMRRLGMIDDSTSPSKGMEITIPVTVLETPKINIFGIRAYKRTNLGVVCVGDVLSAQPKVAGKLGMKKERKEKKERNIEWLDSLVADSEISDVSVLALTYPELAGIPKKKAEVVEIGVGGKDLKEKIDYAKSILGKDVSVNDVFLDGEWADAIAVTRGKGWQGPVKRFGVSKQRRKATGRVRHVGTLGPWHPPYVMYTTPQAGQMGFHRRTQYNARILAVEKDPSKINPAGGFPHYGLVKTDCVIIRGSVQGTQKRFVFLRKGIRVKEPPRKPQILWIA